MTRRPCNDEAAPDPEGDVDSGAIRRNPANRPLSKKLRRDTAQILKRCGHFIA